MVEVSVNNLTKGRIDTKFVEAVALCVINEEARVLLAGRDVGVSVVFVGSARMRRINAAYRKHDCVTDVLSFTEEPVLSETGALGNFVPEGESQSLGELVICPDRVKKDAKELKVSEKDEFAWVIVHGILHLLGYDHEKGEKGAAVMRSKEEAYLSKIKHKSVKLKAKSVK
ncbi:MAG: rRNA maturation RNase YbeY [Candidatus Pacebacteria bacterium]|jgi:probable rRNA maturation factor|nr:rRNA maturation RNase YbeY [Candidatus Paceibacterota bacterium]